MLIIWVVYSLTWRDWKILGEYDKWSKGINLRS